MFNKMFGVSPPPLGQALDSKVDLKKDDQYKTDFDKTLKEKLAVKDKDVDASPPKDLKAKKDDKEFKVTKEKDKDKETDKEEKNSSGGTKKRMNEKVDDQMISMIMASNESEVEIPKSKNDLGPIEESQPKQIQGVSPSVAPMAASGTAAFAVQPQAEAAAPALNSVNEVVVPAEAQLAAQPLPTEFMQKLQSLQQPVQAEAEVEVEAPTEMAPNLVASVSTQVPTAMHAMAHVAPENNLPAEVQQIRSSFISPQAKPQEIEDSDDFYIQPTILPEQPLMEAATPFVEQAPMKAIGEFLPKVQAQAVEMQTAQVAATIPTEAVAIPQAEVAVAAVAGTPLLASVFKSDSSSSVKDFDLEKDLNEEVGFEPEVDIKSASAKTEEKPASLKTQEFQKSVYEQLQKMDQRPPAAAMQSHDGTKGKEAQPSEEKAVDGLKADAINPTEMHHAGQTHSDLRNQAAAPAFAGSEQHRAQILEDNHDKNIKEVMNQAQYLVKKGGGEMKVSLSPDGLAEVQLKVMLQDGKVNIEMHTQDKTVKKLMEDSLSELRSGLAAQHLSVEHVKINTVTATNTDNSAQFQSNWNHGGGEQQQREYWNQFQDNLNQRQNPSRRSSYGAGAESSSGGAMSASASAERVSATPRTYGGTKGSQINWVA